MKVIGITGGVGSGKSEILNIIEKSCNCRILKADNLAKELEKKGEVCFKPIVELLGDEILDADGEINPSLMAKMIFSDESGDKLCKVNEIIHPQVKKRILHLIETEKGKEEKDYFFIEAALLIEDHYDLICDEIWYVFASESVRRERLKASRGYTDEKIEDIMNSQLDDATFRKYCKNVIDNSGSIEESEEIILKLLGKERV